MVKGRRFFCREMSLNWVRGCLCRFNLICCELGNNESDLFWNKASYNIHRRCLVVFVGCLALNIGMGCHWNSMNRLTCIEIWPFHLRSSQKQFDRGQMFQSPSQDWNPLKRKKTNKVIRLSDPWHKKPVDLHDFLTGILFIMKFFIGNEQKVLIASFSLFPQYFIGAASFIASAISSGVIEPLTHVPYVTRTTKRTLKPFKHEMCADLCWECI